MKHPISLEGKTALVTGASKGMGLAIATAAGAAGASVIITGRTRQSIDEVAAGIRERGFNVSAFVLDLSKRQSIQDFADQVKKALPRIDALILNWPATHPSVLCWTNQHRSLMP